MSAHEKDCPCEECVSALRTKIDVLKAELKMVIEQRDRSDYCLHCCGRTSCSVVTCPNNKDDDWNRRKN